ncbi:MAG: GtrA family protein [Planctomycetota bacterium]|nr:GtrA family protein [Planctomycetota bacterium]
MTNAPVAQRPAPESPSTSAWSERRETAKQLRRFLVIGLSSVAADLASYALFLRVLGMDTLPAKGLSYFVGTIVGFIGNKLWTFESRRKSVSEPITYLVLYAITLGINMGVNELMIRGGNAAARAWFDSDHAARALLGVPVPTIIKALAVLVATGVTTVLNFLGMRFVTFRGALAERRALAQRT